jgi:hypothetical protein
MKTKLIDQLLETEQPALNWLENNKLTIKKVALATGLNTVGIEGHSNEIPQIILKSKTPPGASAEAKTALATTFGDVEHLGDFKVSGKYGGRFSTSYFGAGGSIWSCSKGRSGVFILFISDQSELDYKRGEMNRKNDLAVTRDRAVKALEAAGFSQDEISGVLK